MKELTDCVIVIVGVVVLSSILLIMTFPAKAEDTFWHRMTRNADTREKRLRLAEDVRTSMHIDDYVRAIPHLSPRESDWLQKELKADNNRVRKAVRSNEYVIREARRVVEAIDYLLNAIQSNADNDYRHWVNLAYILMDSSETENLGLVCERKIVSPCPFASFENDYRFPPKMNGGMLAKNIVMGVLGPKFGTGYSQ